MAKNKIIIGNWKMNPRTGKEAEKLLIGISKNISSIKKTEVVICAPFVYLEKLKSLKTRARKISLGAQDAFYGDIGAHTGEVSAEMLSGFGVKYVIVGHSERRSKGESSEETNKKLKAVLSAGLIPVLCVGESLRDEKHEYYNFVKHQLLESLNGVSKNLISSVLVAYEPVWAISTTVDRKDATPDDSREMVIFIKKVLSDKFGKDASSTRILYGGSVNEREAGEFIKNGGVDGLLSGRASLDSKKFSEIVKICETLSK